ncbi:MAG: polysaccharide biosynthesis C-terminal domain-containing protein [Clostridia bacterium]|nr:polysaccharide biosynthesis C-terminal domain-containing protein [Clostridia bacterium]
MVAFTIAINVLRKNIKLDLGFSKFVIKPVLATFIMAICSYAAFIIFNNIVDERLATLTAIAVAIIIYIISIIVLKIFTKEEIYMIPYGKKIYKILEKLRNIRKKLTF